MTGPEKNPHGTAARYNHGPMGDGADVCRDDCCRVPQVEAQRARRRRTAYGRGTRDAAPVRAHVHALQKSGLSVCDISRRAAVSERTLGNLLYHFAGRPPSTRVAASTATKLLAVPTPLRADGRLRPAHGTSRRLQGLIATGRTIAALSRALDINDDHLRDLIHRRRGGVTADTERKVRALYDQWWDAPPPETTGRERATAAGARAFAATHGWPMPADWDDSALDDPHGMPAGQRRDLELEKDVGRRLEQGQGLASIAKALDRNPGTIRKVRDRIAREALA